MISSAPGSGLVGHKMRFSRKITMAVGVSVRIRATIRQVGKQVPLVFVQAKSTLFMLHGVYLNTNSQVCGHAYSNINYSAHLVEFGADAAIYHISQGSTIVHAHVIIVL